jgi:hypothetical protein
MAAAPPTTEAAPPPPPATAPPTTVAPNEPAEAPGRAKAGPKATPSPPPAGAAPTATPPPKFGVSGASRPRATAAPASAPEPLLTRTGGRLVGAIRDQNYYVRYEPQAGLRLATLDRAVQGKSFAFEVLPFRQIDAEPVPGGFHVERAGEIVSAALALQLDRMGYRVALELEKALAPLQERLGDRFKIDLSAFRLKATFLGDVRFRVAHGAEGGSHRTTASLDVSVVLTGERQGRAVAVYRRHVGEVEVVTGEGAAGASDRARTAAAGVVGRFVRTLLGDPRLEAVLVAFVGGR